MVVKLGGIVAGSLFIWRCNEIVIIGGVGKLIKERDILLMLSSVVKFSTEFVFFLGFKFLNFDIGVCCDENGIYIANEYLWFSYYCFKYFVFDVGHVEFGDGRTKGDPIEIPSVCIYMLAEGS